MAYDVTAAELFDELKAEQGKRYKLLADYDALKAHADALRAALAAALYECEEFYACQLNALGENHDDVIRSLRVVTEARALLTEDRKDALDAYRKWQENAGAKSGQTTTLPERPMQDSLPDLP